MFVYELSGYGFESSCSHLNFRFRACFEKGVPLYSGNCRVWIHPETRTWHDKNIQSSFTVFYIYNAKVSELKWMNKWETWPPQVRMNPKFLCALIWVITDSISSAMRSTISWSVKNFLSLLITFRTNVRKNTIPPQVRFCFALHLEWSLNRSIDKYQMQFEYLQTCVLL